MKIPFPEVKNVELPKLIEIWSLLIGVIFGVTGIASTVLAKAYPQQGVLDNLAISLLLGIFVAVGFAYAIALLLRGNVYHLEGSDRGGQILIDHVRKAEHSIVCTHFTSEPPSKSYLAVLEEALSKKVTMRRLIHFSGDPCSDVYNWLSQFKDKAGYEQIAVGSALPFNIVIIDQQFVWIFLRARNTPFFRKAIWLRDPEVAELFSVAFEDWQQKHAINGHAENCQIDKCK